jgi:hypothetical protein
MDIGCQDMKSTEYTAQKLKMTGVCEDFKNVWFPSKQELP